MTRISAKEEQGSLVFAAGVYTTLKNGREYSKEYIKIKGNPSNPFPEQELIDK